MCKGLKTSFFDETSNEKTTWHYDHGLDEYLAEHLKEKKCIFPDPFTGQSTNEDFEVVWAINWGKESGNNVEESYVNLIPTNLGGTHVNGFRSGLLESVREFL